MESTSRILRAGWAQADITPEEKAILAGQFHARISEGVRDPVTATALALESAAKPGNPGRTVMVSCDLASIPDEMRDAVRTRVRREIGGLDPECVLIGATHTHTAPDPRMTPYGMEECAEEYRAGLGAKADNDGWGMWPPLDFGVMKPAEYLDFAVDRISGAVRRAWENRAPAGIAYGVGQAVVGRNRRLAYRDGRTVMYGRAGTPEFRHVEGYEDHSVYALMTYGRDGRLTGMVVNVPCPSQVSEQDYLISADYWHETRRQLRARFGEGLFILPQCAPSGDQSPHVLIGRRAEERMWRLGGHEPGQNAPRAEIAARIAAALDRIVPLAEREIDWQPEFEHRHETIRLPRRLISEKDVAEALAEASPFREQYAKLVEEIGKNPEIRSRPRWYTEVTKAYRRMERGARVAKRLEIQRRNPDMPIEAHVVRLGETAFATNPFELYLDYAVRIRELSAATQTFLVQKAGCNGTYLPSARSVASGGYGSVPASTDIGPEGGDKLVEWTVETINRMW